MPSRGVRLVAYDPDGDLRGEIPWPLNARIADVMNDLGSGTIDYLATAPRAEILEDLCEVALEVHDGTDWVEPGARLRRLKRSGSLIEETKTRRYTLPSYGTLLGKVRMLREETLNENRVRAFSALTVGAFVKTLVDEGKSRGAIPGLTLGFTITHDSNGVEWEGSIPPRSLSYGDDLLSQIRSLAEEGIVDWRIVGRRLDMFVPGTLGATKDVTLRNGRDIIEAPDDEDASEMAGRVAVLGDDGRSLEIVAPSAGPWGLEEELIQAPGTTDIGALTLIATVEQEKRSSPRVQMTRQVLMTGKYQPNVHYGIGDTIDAPDDHGTIAPLRVRQITTTIDQNGLGANLVLNDRFIERSLRDSRGIRGLMGGASGSGGGGSGTPSPVDLRTPAAPEGLGVVSTGYWTPDGAPHALVAATWVPVTTAVDGVALAVSGYEFWGRPMDGETPSDVLTFVEGAAAGFSPFAIESTWRFKVRARSTAGVWGPFGDEVEVEMASPDTVLVKPAQPIVTSANRVVTVATTGLFETDPPTSAPPSFREFRIERAPDETGPYVGIGVLNRQVDVRTFNDMQRGDTWWFQLVAIDRLGNESDPSDPVSVEVAGIDGADLVVRSVTAEAVVLGSLTVDHMEPGFGAALEINGNVIITALEEGVAAVGDSVAVVEGEVAAVAGDVATIGTYFDFDVDGLGVSAPGTDYSQLIAADGTSWLQGETVIVNISEGQMTAQAIVVPTATVGNHQFEKAPGGIGTFMRALL